MATKKSHPSERGSSPYDITEIFTELEKVVKIQAVTLSNESRLSTGRLCLDLLLGHGGVTAGLYIFAGPEQSAKTTLAISILASSVTQEVGARVLWDAENSSGSSLNYVENIFRGEKIKVSPGSVFGLKNEKGDYSIKPMVYYRDEGSMDKFFDWTAALLRRLPDKRMMNGKWWFVYEATRENKAAYKNVLDRKMSLENEAIYVPADNGSLQAVILVDSLPSLLADAMDEDDPKAGMALQAREFAKNWPRVKGKLRSKRVAILAINQIREKIGFVMGDPRYEPGGNANKFNCMSADTFMFTERGMVTAQEYFLMKDDLPRILGQSGLEKPTIFDSMGYSQVMKVKTAFGYSMKGKPDHRVLALKNNSLHPEFVTLEYLSRHAQQFSVAIRHGSEVFSAKNVPLSFKPGSSGGQATRLKFPQVINTDWAYALGALIGDGYVRGGRVMFSCDSQCVTKKVCDVLSSTGVHVSGPTSKNSGREFKCEVSSLELGQWLSYLGVGEKSSHTKEVPWVIRQGTRDVQRAFLAGHKDTDNFFSTSEKLTEGLHLMLLNMGVVTTKVSGKESFWNHGLVSTSRPWETKGYGGVDVNKRAKASSVLSLCIYGYHRERLIELLSPFVLHEARAERSAKYSEKEKRESMVVGKLPISDVAWRSEASKLARAMQVLVKDRNTCYRTATFYSDDRYPNLIQDLRGVMTNLRGSHAQRPALEALDNYEELCKFSSDNKIVWAPVEEVSLFNERVMTYDGNMPETHTIVTNGIVSHNSDVRLWLTPRALSSVPFNPKGKGQIEKEPSLDGGEDTYRYIHIKAVKNKLGVPGMETWLRIWVSDSKMRARGFCPVWDTFYALFQTGQLSGKRSAIKLNLSGMGEAAKTISWMEFKTLILGDKDSQTKIYSRIGYKSINLREGLSSMSRKGKLHELLIANTLADIKKAADGDNDDDEDDDADEV